MLDALRLGFRRYGVLSRVADLSYLDTERQLNDEWRDEIDCYNRRGLREGWSVRTTAAVVASVRSGRLARTLEHDRRMRIGEVLTDQDASGVTPLEWLGEFTSGRLNVVGTDTFVVRYNYTNGVLASWVDRGKAVDPDVRLIFIALSAWALAGEEETTVEERLEALLAGLGDGPPGGPSGPGSDTAPR